MKAPFRNKITSRGVDFIRRRVDERVDAFDEDFNRSHSWLLLELRPNVVVFESIRVASSAMITTLAFGSAAVEFSRRFVTQPVLEVPRPATRPPRLNFLPFKTRAGTMGIDD